MATRIQALVAFPSKDQTLVECILDAVSRANAKPITAKYEPWLFNDIAGNPLQSPIIEGIDKAAFVIADITYLNLNVIYEIGFTIGRKKRAFLIRHKGILGDSTLAKAAGIFDTLGYHEYSNSSELSDRLTSHIELTPQRLDETLDRRTPVYIVEPSSRGDAETLMISRLKKARYRYRSFNPNEDYRLSASDAIRQVSVSSGILTCLQADTVVDSIENSIRVMFVVGLAHGLGKPTLVLAPHGMNVPLDVADAVSFYKHPSDIEEHIAEFSLRITEYQQQTDPPPVRFSNRLQSLRIGDPTAENEMVTLSSYYLQIDQYSRALQGSANLIVGRKGSGKTALFIQLRDEIRADKRNVVLDLKPEGYQLVKLKEDILSYLSIGSRQHLITAFWEYLLLLEVTYKLLEKDRHVYKHNHLITQLYHELENTYQVHDFSAEGDFSERLLTLSQRIAREYQARYGEADQQRLTRDQVTQLLYVHDIGKLRASLSKYLEQKQSVWILFDNLDKGWSTSGVDEIDTLILRCLIDASRSIERDMRKKGRTFHCMIFVRNDVYERLMASSSDYGKEMRVVLDWTDRELLRELLRLRLVAGLSSAGSSASLEQLVPQFCISHFGGHEVIDYLLDRALMRPRNLIKILTHCRGFAINFNHERINEDDIQKGLAAYSQDILVELDRELTDIVPAARNLLYHFLDAPDVLSHEQLMQFIRDANVSSDDSGRVLESLLYYAIIGLRIPGRDLYIYDVDYDSRKLTIRINRLADEAQFCINPAFWPALSIRGDTSAGRS